MSFQKTEMLTEDGLIVAAMFNSDTDKTWKGRVFQKPNGYWYQAKDPLGGWGPLVDLPVSNFGSSPNSVFR